MLYILFLICGRFYWNNVSLIVQSSLTGCVNVKFNVYSASSCLSFHKSASLLIWTAAFCLSVSTLDYITRKYQNCNLLHHPCSAETKMAECWEPAPSICFGFPKGVKIRAWHLKRCIFVCLLPGGRPFASYVIDVWLGSHHVTVQFI